MEKNNLDNLFKDNFKDFSEVPEEGVWEKIEASLDKKKKKSIVPIWWQLGGVAAILALLFYAVNPFNSSEENDSIIITDTQNTKTDVKNSTDAQQKLPSITEGNNIVEPTGVTTISIEKDVNPIANDKQSAISKKDKKSKLFNSNGSKAQERVLVATNEIEKAQKETPNETLFTLISNDSISNRQGITKVDNSKKELDLEKSEIENQNSLKIQEENTIAQIEEKKSIFDAIAEQNHEDKEVASEDTQNRWTMGPTVAPVFFDAQGQGSPIHSNFASNKKSGNVNLSYGLQVSYGVSKKLSIRTGVHKVDFGYDTNDVVFSSSLQASTNELIDNISYSQASRNLVVESKSRSEVSAVSDNSLAEFSAASPALEGRMVQQMVYLEVPFELNYALIDKKFGINVIGGVSSLFLIDNSVTLESEGLETEMGRANNVNDINFSTNVGLGFNYEFSSKIQLNLEPVFKYQLNTFSETAGRFRPYTVGVYSGISFKF